MRSFGHGEVFSEAFLFLMCRGISFNWEVLGGTVVIGGIAIIYFFVCVRFVCTSRYF